MTNQMAPITGQPPKTNGTQRAVINKDVSSGKAGAEHSISRAT
jgi:hypothetical protein